MHTSVASPTPLPILIPHRLLRRVGAAALLAVVLIHGSPARASDPDPDPWLGRDKALHFGVSATLASGGYGLGRAFVFDRRLDAALVAGSFTLAIGAAKESYDALGHGDPSWRDFTWDAIGTAVGIGVGLGVDFLIERLTRAGAQKPATATDATR